MRFRAQNLRVEYGNLKVLARELAFAAPALVIAVVVVMALAALAAPTVLRLLGLGQ